ncbi:hypothetical protein D3C83_248840 [compost metagenome]
MQSAVTRGFAVGKGIGIPRSFAVFRSVSSCTGTAWASVIVIASAWECSMPAVFAGSLRSQSG